MSKNKSRLFFGAAFFLNIFFLVLLELAFRWKATTVFDCSLLPQNNTHLNDHFVTHRHPGVGFVLCPKMETKLLDKVLTTNSDGFRDDEFSLTSDNFRILGIGDSVLMGWGVGDKENFLHLAAQSLSVEALNFAVAGYSAFNQFYVLRDIALNYRPDLVVLSYVGNDWEDFPEHQIIGAPSTPSYFLNYILVHLKKHTKWREWRPHPDLAEQPVHLAHAYELMAKELSARGIPVILVMDSRYQSPLFSHKAVQEMALYHGFEVLDLYERFRPLELSLTVEQATDPEREHNKKYIIQGDGHANELWHQDVSEELIPLLRQHLKSKK